MTQRIGRELVLSVYLLVSVYVVMNFADRFWVLRVMDADGRAAAQLAGGAT